MKVTFTPIYNRKKKLNDQGKAPIEIRVYQNRKRKFFSTGIFIEPAQWDDKRDEINKKHSGAEMLNIQIQTILNDYEKIQTQQLVKGKTVSINSITNQKSRNPNDSFINFVESEIETNQTISLKTKVSHRNVLNKLKEFKKGDVKFADIDYSFVHDYLKYLRLNKLADNTVHKQHKTLKQYIELAIKKEYFDGKNPCKDFKVKINQKKREVLTLEEVGMIEKVDLSKYEEKINLVRDMFLFACYTGLRISDVTNLQRDFVKKDKGYSLDFMTVKVNKRAELPLHSLFKSKDSHLSKPEIILEKYYNKENKFIFPKISEPYINRHLKLITSLTDIEIKVTFHIARHTFGTYMASKIPLPQLMYLMQHSDIKTTMLYVNTNQELVKQGLLKVDWE